MRIIPVLDLRRGRAVHAVAGDRSHYRPLRSILHAKPDPLELARACRDRLGTMELYLADLDAIEGGPPAVGLYRAISNLGLNLWVDAGVRNAEDASIFTRPAQDRAAGQRPGEGSCLIVLGLETLAGRKALRAIVDQNSPDRLVFSLDLCGGLPLVAPGSDWGTADPARLASLAIESGIRRGIVLDLTRVGTGRGVGTLSLLRSLRQSHPDCEWIAGGGIAAFEDLIALEDAGASAALVGTALHSGRIVPRTEGSVLDSSGGRG
jgi:phosphoribosylformimino-5-aminoimidazole carboxamide ribotide isomerase